MAARVSRPYARKRGGPPSVTTVLAAMGGKDGLPWGASKETARYVVEHIDDVVAAIGIDKEAEYDHLRKHFRGVWDFAADIGTALHGVNEAWIDGTTVDLEQVVPDRVVKAGRETDFLSRLPGFVDGLERFWLDCEPKTVAAEYVVRHPEHDYVGTVDWRVVLPRVHPTDNWLIDLKTTQEQDPEKGTYVDSWRLQLCGYDRAAVVVEYDDDGNEIGTRGNTRADRYGVVHLRGDGDYRLIELDCSDDVFDVFLHARKMHDWLKTGHKSPAPVIVRPELKVEAVA